MPKSRSKPKDEIFTTGMETLCLDLKDGVIDAMRRNDDVHDVLYALMDTIDWTLSHANIDNRQRKIWWKVIASTAKEYAKTF